MSEREDSKINWISCPDCGAKIGVIISVGKPSELITVPRPETVAPWPPGGIEERLAASGVDLTLVDVDEGEEIVTVSPKRFLGDLWGPINDAIKSLGGGWIREGRESRWEIRKEDMD
ncbi:MAG: hypothetical protein JSV18_07510 [Candidatus Bathyarchaeota archaeon]|nr:MAG: hypothetical protein JSV18_07510 [Candidatus Bathyarchaeota archaeon]